MGSLKLQPCVCGCWMAQRGRERARSLWGGREDTRPEGDPLLAVIALLVLQKQGSSTRGGCQGQELQIVNHSEVRWINLQWPNRQEESLLIGGFKKSLPGCARLQEITARPALSTRTSRLGCVWSYVCQGVDQANRDQKASPQPHPKRSGLKRVPWCKSVFSYCSPEPWRGKHPFRLHGFHSFLIIIRLLLEL